jgi:pimeloyl-ACP methyl ester carboxylesterase
VKFSTVRLATGPRLRYAESGDAGGAPVVLLHGWPDSCFSWSKVMPHLARHRVLALDQRGFGDSERPASGYAIDDFASDVAAFLDALSIGRAAVVGHSFGSLVARRVALAHPERVSKLVLIGTGASARNPVLLEVREAIKDLADPVPIDFAREFQASTMHLPIPDDFFEGLLAESLKLPARLWREVFESIVTYDDASDVARIAAPTLLLWGEKDALFPRKDQDRLVATIPGARLVVYEETGHCPNWERPERVAADLDAFLTER